MKVKQDGECSRDTQIMMTLSSLFPKLNPPPRTRGKGPSNSMKCTELDSTSAHRGEAKALNTGKDLYRLWVSADWGQEHRQNSTNTMALPPKMIKK